VWCFFDFRDKFTAKCYIHTFILLEVYMVKSNYINIQDAAERTPPFEKQINSKPKKIRQIFFYFWKEHRMPFYINVF